MDADFLSKDYWNNRYATNTTGWDIGQISTPLKTYFDQLTNKEQRILIPGGGNGHEAAYLVENGFTNITVIDISPIAISHLHKRFEKEINQAIHLINANFFELDGKYDLIIEQTFFCALDPQLREAYAQKMAELLSENGQLVGLLFDTNFENSPPFGGSKEEYQRLFSKYLVIDKMERCYNSVPPRKDTELFFKATRKAID